MSLVCFQCRQPTKTAYSRIHVTAKGWGPLNGLVLAGKLVFRLLFTKSDPLCEQCRPSWADSR